MGWWQWNPPYGETAEAEATTVPFPRGRLYCVLAGPGGPELNRIFPNYATF